MVNLRFLSDFAKSFAVFKPYRISDHCPVVLSIPIVKCRIINPFKFMNFIVHKKDFLPMAEQGWKLKVVGFFMYQVTQKLKSLKSPCHKLFDSCSKFSLVEFLLE